MLQHSISRPEFLHCWAQPRSSSVYLHCKQWQQEGKASPNHSLVALGVLGRSNTFFRDETEAQDQK